MDRNPNITMVFLAAEAVLAVLALLIAFWAEIPLGERLLLNYEVVQRGVVAGIAMLVVVLAMYRFIIWNPIVQLRQQVEAIVAEIFEGASWPELAAVSIAAGVGEELLFRGALQPWLAMVVEPWLAIVVVSCVFGALHAMSNAYFVAATAIGLLFGWMTEHYNDLVAPIIAHAIYDFFALLIALRSSRSAKTI